MEYHLLRRRLHFRLALYWLYQSTMYMRVMEYGETPEDMLKVPICRAVKEHLQTNEDGKTVSIVERLRRFMTDKRGKRVFVTAVSNQY